MKRLMEVSDLGVFPIRRERILDENGSFPG